MFLKNVLKKHGLKKHGLKKHDPKKHVLKKRQDFQSCLDRAIRKG